MYIPNASKQSITKQICVSHDLSFLSGCIDMSETALLINSQSFLCNSDKLHFGGIKELHSCAWLPQLKNKFNS